MGAIGETCNLGNNPDCQQQSGMIFQSGFGINLCKMAGAHLPMENGNRGYHPNRGVGETFQPGAQPWATQLEEARSNRAISTTGKDAQSGNKSNRAPRLQATIGTRFEFTIGVALSRSDTINREQFDETQSGQLGETAILGRKPNRGLRFLP